MINPNDFNTKEDFENFVKQYPEIKSISEFKKRFEGIYARFLKLKRDGIVVAEDFPIATRRPNYNLNVGYKTVGDFQRYINENKIKSSLHLREVNTPLYARMSRLGFVHKVKYLEHTDWRYYDSEEKIQDFVFENNIKSKTDLKKRDIQVYRALCKLVKTEEVNIVFKNTVFGSSYEAKLYYYLRERNIYFDTQKYIEKFRYDFIDFANKVIVEVHGGQHFNVEISKNAWGEKARNEKENDLVKRDCALSHGYKIFYFTYDKSELERSGYFDKVYTEEEELVEVLREVKKLPYMPPNFEELKLNYKPAEIVEEKIPMTNREIMTLEDLNQFIQDCKISSPTIFINEYSNYHSKAEKLGWINKIKYYREEGEVGSIKNYRTFEDFQEFIMEFKIVSKKNFKRDYQNVYTKAWKLKYLNKLEYYSDESEE